MKTVTIYVDEISNRRFDKEEDAIASEKNNGSINKMFSFWKKHHKDEGCNFAKGGWAYQRKESDYVKLKETICEAVKMYEPWIYKQYEKDGGLKPEHCGSDYMIGRYLSDGNSEIYEWYIILSNVCQKCFREHGQMYHANHCTHDKEIRPL